MATFSTVVCPQMKKYVTVASEKLPKFKQAYSVVVRQLGDFLSSIDDDEEYDDDPSWKQRSFTAKELTNFFANKHNIKILKVITAIVYEIIVKYQYADWHDNPKDWDLSFVSEIMFKKDADPAVRHAPIMINIYNPMIVNFQNLIDNRIDVFHFVDTRKV